MGRFLLFVLGVVVIALVIALLGIPLLLQEKHESVPQPVPQDEEHQPLVKEPARGK